jgi:hypothetical protein
MTNADERFWSLAAVAAERLVRGPAVTRSLVTGILSQWIAENGWGWAPPRNNPGNLAQGWTDHFKNEFPCHVAPGGNPQPGNPIMTFDKVNDGALCYAAGLATFSRYAKAVALGKAGDGLGFAVEICRQAYGTRESTVKSVFANLAPHAVGQAAVARRINVAIRYCRVTQTLDMVQLKAGQPLFDSPGGRAVTKMSADATVPRLGLAGSVNGAGWCGVVVGTSWSYADKMKRPTGLYVPVADVTVVPA